LNTLLLLPVFGRDGPIQDKTSAYQTIRPLRAQLSCSRLASLHCLRSRPPKTRTINYCDRYSGGSRRYMWLKYIVDRSREWPCGRLLINMVDDVRY